MQALFKQTISYIKDHSSSKKVRPFTDLEFSPIECENTQVGVFLKDKAEGEFCASWEKALQGHSAHHDESMGN